LELKCDISKEYSLLQTIQTKKWNSKSVGLILVK
jgi:hypothetical protein